jgi:hypothetical protein
MGTEAAAAALAIANGIRVGAPVLYGRGRLGLLLALVIPYVAASSALLGAAADAFPLATVAVAVVLAAVPLLVLGVCLLDFRFGLFATDIFWALMVPIFGLAPLGPASSVLYLLAAR